VRSSTRRTILWALALVVALVLAGVGFVRSGEDDDAASVPESPSPHVPEADAVGEGCGEAAVTDPADVGVARTVARCAPGSPEAAPLAAPAIVRVAVTARSEAIAPLLVAFAHGELEAENLRVEIVDMEAVAAYEAMAAGDVDVVVGGIDAPFFDAVHEGLGARLVMGGPITRSPGDVETAQAGLWLRADLISEEDDWENVAGQTVLLPGGLGSGAVYPIETTLRQNELNVNVVDLVAASAADAAARLLSAEVGGAWLPEPVPDAVADDGALRLVATLPGSESIDGTVLSPRLLGPDRAVGSAYVRAIVRTINTHLADGYGDEALPVVAEALDVDEDALTAGPALLFDWELRAGTAQRIQESLISAGGVRYERATGEADLVDRTVVAEVVTPG
jgi:NitT/TauT family transport system substrate-binding protein